MRSLARAFLILLGLAPSLSFAQSTDWSFVLDDRFDAIGEAFRVWHETGEFPDPSLEPAPTDVIEVLVGRCAVATTDPDVEPIAPGPCWDAVGGFMDKGYFFDTEGQPWGAGATVDDGLLQEVLDAFPQPDSLTLDAMLSFVGDGFDQSEVDAATDHYRDIADK